MGHAGLLQPGTACAHAPTLTVLDLDGSIIGQKPVRDRIAAGRARVIDMRDLGRALRLWGWDRDYAALEARLPQPLDGAEIVMLGSGDYHHLTAALIARRTEPLTVVHFDNHPDWAWTFPRRHCGSWVNAALAMPHVAKVVTIGCCSDDLGWPDRAGENLRAMRSGRLDVQPWHRVPTRLGKHAQPVPGHDVVGDRLFWRNLRHKDWEEVLSSIVRSLPDTTLWLTIDKDVLSHADAATNWDQGALPLGLLERAIVRLAAERRILGVDICGDYSPARHRHPMKIVEALLDQRQGPPAGLEVNARTNAVLLDLLEATL